MTRPRHKKRAPGKRKPAIPTSLVRDASGPRWIVWFCLAMIVAAGAISFANSFDGVFIYDDAKWVVMDAPERDKAPIRNSLLRSRRPLVELTLAANYRSNAEYKPNDYETKSSDIEPWGYHLVNLIVHLLAAMTLYGVVRRTLLLTRFSEALSRGSHWFALAVAMIWVVHPLQTQSVTYIIQRAESMMGLFYLLTLYCFIRSISSTKRSLIWSILAVVACACGMGSKAIMVTAPLLVFVYDRTFVSKTFGELFRKRWWLYLGLAATLWILFMLGIAQGALSMERKGAATLGLRLANKDHPQHISSVGYLLTESQVLLHYIKLSFWPEGQALDYPWPIVKSVREVVLSGSAILVLLAAVFIAFIKRPWAGFAGAWFFLILAPTSSIIPVKDPIYEHRMYLPLAGIVVLVIGSLWWLLRRAMARGDGRGARVTLAGAAFILPIVLALGYATHVRNKAYHSETAMWSDIIAKHPTNGRAHNNLGKHLLDSAGDDKALISEAVAEFRKATKIDETLFSAFYNMGNGLQKLKRYDEAIAAHLTAIKKRPRYLEAHIMLGNAYTDAGRMAEAEAAFRAALKCRSPHSQHEQRYLMARAHFNLGNTLYKLRRDDEAAPQYEAALKANPEHYKAAYGLGTVHQRLNNTEAAIEAYKYSLSINPRFDKPCVNLSVLYVEMGRVADAVGLCETTLEKNPGSLNLIQRLAAMYRQQQRHEDVIALYEAKLRAYPSSLALLRGLAAAYERSERFAEAFETCQKALELNPNDRKLKEMKERLQRRWQGKRK